MQVWLFCMFFSLDSHKWSWLLKSRFKQWGYLTYILYISNYQIIQTFFFSNDMSIVFSKMKIREFKMPKFGMLYLILYITIQHKSLPAFNLSPWGVQFQWSHLQMFCQASLKHLGGGLRLYYCYIMLCIILDYTISKHDPHCESVGRNGNKTIVWRCRK